MENPHRNVRICTQMYAFVLFFFAAAAKRRRGQALGVVPIHNVKEQAEARIGGFPYQNLVENVLGYFSDEKGSPRSSTHLTAGVRTA